MTFTYQIDQEDFVSAGKLLLRTRKAATLRRVLVTIAQILLLASLATFLYLHQFVTAAAAGFFFLVYACFPLSVGWQYRRQFRKIPALHPPRTMEADARGIRVVSAVSDGRFDWQLLDRFAENDRVFLLVQQGGRVFFPVSKRQMMPAEVEEFRSLCTTYILHS